MTGEETLTSIGDLALSMLHETQWDDFILLEDNDAADKGGIKKLIAKQIKKIETKKSTLTNEASTIARTPSIAKALNSNTITSDQQAAPANDFTVVDQKTARITSMLSRGSGRTLSLSATSVGLLQIRSVAGNTNKSEIETISEAVEVISEERNKPAQDTDRAQKIENLLETGRHMMVLEVFAIPKLHWGIDETAPADEVKALNRAGFLIESYHAHAWWWEIYEMVRYH